MFRTTDEIKLGPRMCLHAFLYVFARFDDGPVFQKKTGFSIRETAGGKISRSPERWGAGGEYHFQEI